MLLILNVTIQYLRFIDRVMCDKYKKHKNYELPVEILYNKT